MTFGRVIVATIVLASLSAPVALAQMPADFYRGKSIEVDINVSVLLGPLSVGRVPPLF